MVAPEPQATEQGLTSAEATTRLRQDGPNELPQDRRRRLPRIVLDAVQEPMLQLLLAAGLIYLLLGNLAEALILLSFAVLNVAMVVVQEARTATALEALLELTSPHALVWRDGAKMHLPARVLVAGDVIEVREGERVPADATLLEASSLHADEALLTGESVPVRKLVDTTSAVEGVPGGKDSPLIWAGSLVTAGSGIARVTATGPRTEVGRIGHSLSSVEAAVPPLQVQMRRLIWLFAAAGIGASGLLAIAYGLLHGQWLQAVLSGITLAMATLPQEFPLVLTSFLVLGARRMSRHHVLARRAAAIEALGTTTLLCTDKTGTLTQNCMSVVRLVAAGEVLDVNELSSTLPEAFHPLVEFSILASRPNPFDPVEQAFHRLGQMKLANTEHLHADWVLAHGYPLKPELLAMSQAWCGSADGVHVVAAKGAPEAIADLCHMDARKLEVMLHGVAEMAAEGLRVLGVAKGLHTGPDWPESQHDFDFVFLGLVGLADPLRPGVPEVIAACRQAGISVAMITGDHPATALAIARQAGIESRQVLTGAQMAELDDTALLAAVTGTRVFARVMPEQKLRLVQAFAANGEIVAMTGDGVNDAPSLKAAHIGVAMGLHGTDVAREAASLVLLDDDFTNLIAAIRLGRRIDANLRKAFSYILAAHVPIAGMSLIPVLLGWPLMLGPVHVVFLEMIIDPTSSIAFEAETEDSTTMLRPPRKPSTGLFSLSLLAGGLVQGTSVLIATLLVSLMGTHSAVDESTSRAMAFITLVTGNLGLILSNKALGESALVALRRPNRALGIVTTIAISALGLTLALPQLRYLFGFALLTLRGVSVAVLAGFACLAMNLAWAQLWRRLACPQNIKATELGAG
ncbi:cation-translocating P-type ATPase [Acidocella sp.]|uniref:cation-translocating P-type ATPase n=1 Tax=Acidocella sp. TaxID=50710 RepID=UPI002609F5D8|nr:cation-translocating P-type ATPase [Acidocella sp.]